MPPPNVKKFTRKLRKLRQIQSEWTLVFDTETNTDAAQALRFGVYHLYNGDQLDEAGIFIDPDGHHYSDDGDFYCVDCWRAEELR